MKLTAKQIKEFETAAAARTIELPGTTKNTSAHMARPKTGGPPSRSSENSNVFGMRKSKPQNTYRHDVRKLDKLIDGFNSLYQEETEIEKQQLDIALTQHQIDLYRKTSQQRDQKIALKLELERQIKAQELTQVNQKMQDLAVAATTEQAFNQNENLYSLHPRIFVKPSYKAREDELQNQKVIAQTLQKQIDERKSREKADQQQSNQQSLAFLQTSMDKFDQQETEKQQQKEQLRKLVLDELVQQNKIKVIESLVQNDSHLLQNEIIYGQYATLESKPATSLPASKNFTNLFDKQRKRAEFRAKMHGKIQEINKCHFVEIDPRPDLPLDNVLWGNPGSLFSPLTSYSYSFQDPKKILEQQREFKHAFQKQMDEEFILNSLDEKMGNFSEVNNQDEEKAEDENQMSELNEKNDEQIEVASPDLEGKEVSIKSLLSLRTSQKSRSMAKSHNSIGQRSLVSTTNRSGKQEQDIFESKSIVSLKSSITQKKEEVVWKKLAKSALNEGALQSKSNASDQLSSAASSNYIRKKITELAYSSNKLTRATEEGKDQSRKLMLAQQRAQRNAFERVVESMASETIQGKRVAEERRAMNQSFDDRKMCNQIKLAEEKKNILSYQQAQISEKEQLNIKRQIIEKTVPQISGCYGYPPKFEPTYEEVKQLDQQTAKVLRQELQNQVSSKFERRNQKVIDNLQLDQQYLAGFKEVQTQEEIKHTSGNVGHIYSVPLEELERRKREEQRNLQIQLKMEQLKKLKEKLYHDKKILVQSDKLDSLLETTTKKLAYIQSTQSFYNQNQAQVVRNSVAPRRVAELLESHDYKAESFTPRAPTVKSMDHNQRDVSTRASENPKPDQISLLEKISLQISQKPKTANLKTRYTVKDSRIDADAASAWDKIASEMAENEGTRTLDFPQKMDRRRTIENEHSFRRGCYSKNTLPHPFAVSQNELNEKGDENVIFPWESREESFRQFRDLIAPKPGK